MPRRVTDAATRALAVLVLGRTACKCPAAIATAVTGSSTPFSLVEVDEVFRSNVIQCCNVCVWLYMIRAYMLHVYVYEVCKGIRFALKNYFLRPKALTY